MQYSPKRFVTPENWFTCWLEKPYFQHLDQLFALRKFDTFIDVQTLNSMARKNGLEDIQFVCDHALQNNEATLQTDGLYYEEIIYKTGCVPTRPKNWHDLFNALIWCLFPASKKALNQLHISEIQQHGLHPRTAVRNRVTHFDECGAVLTYRDEAHLEALQNHRWHEAFVEKRSAWQQSTKLFMFGHANYEMLLAPYIGLTGKYIAVAVSDEFYQMPLLAQYQYLDGEVSKLINSGSLFREKKVMKPLPLLGIPGWDADNESPDYYRNQDYFRPLRARG